MCIICTRSFKLVILQTNNVTFPAGLSALMIASPLLDNGESAILPVEGTTPPSICPPGGEIEMTTF